MEELQASDPRQIGSYTLHGRLGVGGMGQVFLGRSRGGRLAAVKVIHPHLVADQEFRTRFAREVQAVRRVSGVFTAPVIDADAEAPQPWLATGYVNGPTLSAAVAAHGPLPVPSVLALAAGLAEGLSAVHAAGVIHRDLKPSNVLLAGDGPRLIDFGISQAAGLSHLTRTGMILGTPGFMSPEQAEGLTVSPASDIFSLGAVLLFAATGTRLSYFVPPLDQVPAELRPLIARCTAMDPQERPSATEFLTELVTAHPAAAEGSDWLPEHIVAGGKGLSGAASAPEAGWNSTVTSPPPRLSGKAQPPAPDPGPLLPEPAEQPVKQAKQPVRQQAERPARQSAARAGKPAGPPARPRGSSKAAAAGALAAVALLAVAAALYVIAPWRGRPPVLRPTGLMADVKTVSSIDLSWSNPSSGPLPDKYLITRDNVRIGTVAGTAPHFHDTGLMPATPYVFRVIAERGGTTSMTSAALTVSTTMPALLAALMKFDGYVREKLVYANPPDSNWQSLGSTWRDRWKLIPDCAAGACGATLHGAVSGTPFTTRLSRSGSVYTGQTAVPHGWYCKSRANVSRSTLSIRLIALRTGIHGKTREVTSFIGTETWKVAGDKAAGCGASTFRIQVTA